MVRKTPANLGLPLRPFLYTIDQVASFLDQDVNYVKTKQVYFWGRSTGTPHAYYLRARNIAPPDEKPDWRVTEQEMIRWLKMKGFKLYEVCIAHH